MNHEVSWSEFTATALKAPCESFHLLSALRIYSVILSKVPHLMDVIKSRALKLHRTSKHGDFCRRFCIRSDAGHRVFVSLHPRLIRLQLDVRLWRRDLDKRERVRRRWGVINRQGIVTIYYFIASCELIWCLVEEIFQSFNTHTWADTSTYIHLCYLASEQATLQTKLMKWPLNKLNLKCSGYIMETWFIESKYCLIFWGQCI